MFSHRLFMVSYSLLLLWHSSRKALKTSVLFTLIYDIQIEMLHQLLCVYSYHMQNYRHLYAIHNLFFSSLFSCRCETHIPRKMPKTKDFYEFTRCRQQTVSTCIPNENISPQNHGNMRNISAVRILFVKPFPTKSRIISNYIN